MDLLPTSPTVQALPKRTQACACKIHTWDVEEPQTQVALSAVTVQFVERPAIFVQFSRSPHNVRPPASALTTLMQRVASNAAFLCRILWGLQYLGPFGVSTKGPKSSLEILKSQPTPSDAAKQRLLSRRSADPRTWKSCEVPRESNGPHSLRDYVRGRGEDTARLLKHSRLSNHLR